LFRNYIVCFVGYSIDDPVLRYMTDALAADRLLGESPLEMFAFGPCSRGKETDGEREWRAKNVTPILYCNHRKHRYLHETLRVWAEIYRDGIGGKESIVVRYAGLRPSQSTPQDDFAGRMVWALSDPSGRPAKRFAEFDPVPSLDWLGPLSENRFGKADLSRFGIGAPSEDSSENLGFSLLRRPAPSTHAPWMALADRSAGGGRLDRIMVRFVDWLARHLDNPDLLLRLADEGGKLHPDFVGGIERRMMRMQDAEIRPAMRTLWILLLAGKIQQPFHGIDLFRWKDRFEREGLTAGLRLQLRDTIAPRLSLRKRFSECEPESAREKPERPCDLVEGEIVLSAEGVRSYPPVDLHESECWRKALPELLEDFSALLRDAMDLMREFGIADDEHDPAFFDLPSIGVHPQNMHFRDWTVLIELTRDAWLETAAIVPARAPDCRKLERRALSGVSPAGILRRNAGRRYSDSPGTRPVAG